MLCTIAALMVGNQGKVFGTRARCKTACSSGPCLPVVAASQVWSEEAGIAHGLTSTEGSLAGPILHDISHVA